MSITDGPLCGNTWKRDDPEFLLEKLRKSQERWIELYGEPNPSLAEDIAKQEEKLK